MRGRHRQELSWTENGYRWHHFNWWPHTRILPKTKRTLFEALYTLTIFLSDRTTLTTGIYKKEKRIRLKNEKQPEKKISFSGAEWLLLTNIISEIHEYVKTLREDSSAPPKTWDLQGNKQVTAKRFTDSRVIILDFRVFNFHIVPALPTKFGIALNDTEWEKFHETYQDVDQMEQCMKSIIKKILHKMVSCKSKEQCHGCLTDQPSQKQHMEMAYHLGRKRETCTLQIAWTIFRKSSWWGIRGNQRWRVRRREIPTRCDGRPVLSSWTVAIIRVIIFFSVEL